MVRKDFAIGSSSSLFFSLVNKVLQKFPSVPLHRDSGEESAHQLNCPVDERREQERRGQLSLGWLAAARRLTG